jgi:hypothetical protein
MKEIQIIASAKRINGVIESMLLDMDSFTEEDMWLLQDKIEVHTKNIIELCRGD